MVGSTLALLLAQQRLRVALCVQPPRPPQRQQQQPPPHPAGTRPRWAQRHPGLRAQHRIAPAARIGAGLVKKACRPAPAPVTPWSAWKCGRPGRCLTFRR